MDICILLSILFLYHIYSALEGRREAFYWYIRNLASDSTKITIGHTEHIWFAMQRGCVLIIIGLLCGSVIIPICLACMFIMVHDGYYYATRNDLDSETYPKRFVDYSTTSTTKLTLKFWVRLTIYAIGLSGFTYTVNYPRP